MPWSWILKLNVSLFQEHLLIFCDLSLGTIFTKLLFLTVDSSLLACWQDRLDNKSCLWVTCSHCPCLLLVFCVLLLVEALIWFDCQTKLHVHQLNVFCNICVLVKNPKHWQPYNCWHEKAAHSGRNGLHCSCSCWSRTQVRWPEFPTSDKKSTEVKILCRQIAWTFALCFFCSATAMRGTEELMPVLTHSLMLSSRQQQ